MPEPSESVLDSSTANAPVAPSPARRLEATLRERQDLGRGTSVLRLRIDEPMPARAGQFAMVRCADWGSAPLLPRPMSLLTGGHEPSFLIKAVGDGTRRLTQAPAGTRLSLLGPLGTPWAHPPMGAQVVLVAGGVGLPPLLFLGRELAALAREHRVSRPPTIGLYGGRTADDLLLSRELEAVAELRAATEDGSRGSRGLVTALLDPALDEVAQSGHEAHVFACGPHAMMAAVAQIAARRGVPCQVSLETRMACGYGVCLGCATPRAQGGYLYACSEGPCVNAAEIDWRAEAPQP